MSTKIYKLVLVCIVTITTLVSTNNLRAAAAANSAGSGDAGYLQQIADNTYQTLQAINNSPTSIRGYLNSIAMAITALISADSADSSPTPAMQANFASLANSFDTSITQQLALQPRLVKDFFQQYSKGDGTYPDYINANANAMSYQTLLGQPLFSEQGDTDTAYSYIRNASGINLGFALPVFPNAPAKFAEYQRRYAAFFNMTAAVQTYNSYVLSQLYTDSKLKMSQAEQSLIQQASNPTTWFAEIATENIGAVFRQILMYDSQIYILLTQMLDTQKKILAAQVMNNSLTVFGNSTNAQMLYRTANGEMGNS